MGPAGDLLEYFAFNLPSSYYDYRDGPFPASLPAGAHIPDMAISTEPMARRSLGSLVAAALLATAAGVDPLSSGAAAATPRRIGWWWDAPATASNPSVQALIDWCSKHKDITTSVLMRCGAPSHERAVNPPPNSLTGDFAT